MKNVIFHIDVNSAFLSWEAVYRLHHLGWKGDLREQVSAVGGDTAMRSGIILAKSVPAKRYGIQTGESVLEARKKYPQLILVPPNYGLYEQCSKGFLDILHQYSPKVEQYSIDEAFVDMTGTEGLWGTPVEGAQRMRRQIQDTLGFTVNIGISENKLLAKMASDFQKPNQVHTLWREEIETKMWQLPVGALFFVGKVTEQKLYKLGIQTIGELAVAQPEILKQHLKKHGEVIWNFANGRDVSVVEEAPAVGKGYGNSTTIPFDVSDLSGAKLVLLGLAETVGARLRAAGVQAEVIGVGVKTFDFAYSTHQMTLHHATNITMEIYQCAVRLLEELWDGTPVRHLGIHTSRIQEHTDMRQIELFETMDYEKTEKLDAAVDRIRRRFGNDAVKRAAFLGTGIDHMSGGISREKRAVDYKKIKAK